VGWLGEDQWHRCLGGRVLVVEIQTLPMKKIDIMRSTNCKLLCKVKGNSIIWQHIWHNDKQIWVHIPCVCHPFQSHLIINIMVAAVYIHTNEQTNKQTIKYTHIHTHLFKTKSCRSWHNFHFRQVIATQYFQIKTYCIICKNVFDYECSQIFGMSCYIIFVVTPCMLLSYSIIIMCKFYICAVVGIIIE